MTRKNVVTPEHENGRQNASPIFFSYILVFSCLSAIILRFSESIFMVKDNQLYSLVVFVGDSTFKTEMPENVTSGFGYVRYIKSKKRPVFSQQEVAEIITKIEQARLSQSFETYRAHIKHVKTIQSQKKNIVTCPRVR